jgi:hypothetical protein
MVLVSVAYCLQGCHEYNGFDVIRGTGPGDNLCTGDGSVWQKRTAAMAQEYTLILPSEKNDRQ